MNMSPGFELCPELYYAPSSRLYFELQPLKKILKVTSSQTVLKKKQRKREKKKGPSRDPGNPLEFLTCGNKTAMTMASPKQYRRSPPRRKSYHTHEAQSMDWFYGSRALKLFFSTMANQEGHVPKQRGNKVTLAIRLSPSPFLFLYSVPHSARLRSVFLRNS